MLAYPGGTWWNPTSDGFDLVENFWCDLMRPKTHGGQDNTRAAFLARTSLTILALVLPLFFREFSKRYGLRPRLKRLLELGADLGALSLLGVALGTKLADWLHEVAIVGLGPFGLVALIAAVFLTLKRDGWAVRIAGIFAVFFALWNMGQYARETLLGTPNFHGLPLVQRLATIALWAWLLLVNQGFERKPKTTPRPQQRPPEE
jgi:hypothetical protein